MSSNGTPRVLLVKHWIDIHDRGLRLIAARCKDAGFEVIYATYSQPDEVVKMAMQEDVDVVGISFFSSAYEQHLPRIMDGLKKNSLNLLVCVGGVIPDDDHEMIKKQGVREIFAAGSDVNGFIELIKTEIKK